MSLQKLQLHILRRTLAAWFIIAFTGRGGKSRLVALMVCKQCFGDCTADITRENKFYLGLGCSKIRQKRSSVSLLLKPIVVGYQLIAYEYE